MISLRNVVLVVACVGCSGAGGADPDASGAAGSSGDGSTSEVLGATDGGAGGSPCGQYPVPTQNASLGGFTYGPDGNIWFTERLARKIGRTWAESPRDLRVKEFDIPSKAAPADIVAGPDGALWFTEPGMSRIGRITTSGTVTEFPLPDTSSRPTRIVTGADGNLWFTDEGLTTKIGRITVAGVVTEFPTPAPHGGLFQGLTNDADSAVWYLRLGTMLGRIAPDGTFTEQAVETEAAFNAFAWSPDGAFWGASDRQAMSPAGSSMPSISRFTSSGSSTQYLLPEAQIPAGLPSILDIVAGADDKVWFTVDVAPARLNSGALWFMTGAGLFVKHLDTNPGRLMRAPDGNIWMTTVEAYPRLVCVKSPVSPPPPDAGTDGANDGG